MDMDRDRDFYLLQQDSIDELRRDVRKISDQIDSLKKTINNNKTRINTLNILVKQCDASINNVDALYNHICEAEEEINGVYTSSTITKVGLSEVYSTDINKIKAEINEVKEQVSLKILELEDDNYNNLGRIKTLQNDSYIATKKISKINMCEDIKEMQRILRG